MEYLFFEAQPLKSKGYTFNLKIISNKILEKIKFKNLNSNGVISQIHRTSLSLIIGLKKKTIFMVL